MSVTKKSITPADIFPTPFIKSSIGSLFIIPTKFSVILGIVLDSPSIILIACGPKASTIEILRSLIALPNLATAPFNVLVTLASIVSSAPEELLRLSANASHAEAAPSAPSFTPSSRYPNFE